MCVCVCVCDISSPRWDSNPRSQQASGPAARLLRSWVRIPPGATNVTYIYIYIYIYI